MVPELRVLSEHTALALTDERATFVARILPPPAPTEQRPPVRLLLALDVSGSMNGTPLETAVLSARGLVRALAPLDTFGAVAFHDSVAVLAPPQRTTAAGKAIVEEQLLRASASGGTDLASGMLKALDLANATETGGRVLLLTDGCPTTGATDENQILTLARGALGPSTLSTFGFGRAVNAGLLSNLADLGRGHYTFIETGETPVAAIGAELGGLLATVATGVELTLEVFPGGRLEQVYRSTGVTHDGPRATVALPSLIGDEPVAVVFRLAWDEASVGKPIARLRLVSRSTETGAKNEAVADLVVPVAMTRGAFVPEAAREVLLARAALVLFEASEAMKRARQQTDPRQQAAASLSERLGELRGAAQAAGVIADPEVSAALSMIERLVSVMARSDRGHAQQNMVAAAAALRSMKGTILGVTDAFVSSSQRSGVDRIRTSIMGIEPKKKSEH
jgi:Ca-activated chloride channel family protein